MHKPRGEMCKNEANEVTGVRFKGNRESAFKRGLGNDLRYSLIGREMIMTQCIDSSGASVKAVCQSCRMLLSRRSTTRLPNFRQLTHNLSQKLATQYGASSSWLQIAKSSPAVRSASGRASACSMVAVALRREIWDVRNISKIAPRT